MSSLPFRPEQHGGLLYLGITPKSARPAVAGLYTAADGKVSLHVKVRAQPEKGKANEAAIFWPRSSASPSGPSPSPPAQPIV